MFLKLADRFRNLNTSPERVSGLSIQSINFKETE
jgi:hypothetical protein